MQIVRRNDKYGNPIGDDVRITKDNCPELQEILDDACIRIEKFSTQQ